MSGSLVLPRARSWDDRNDRVAIEQYERHCDGNRCYALCMTSGSETYHHWKIFTSGIGGVCLKLDRRILLDHLGTIQNATLRDIQYWSLNEFKASELDVNDIPFIKRYAYRDEKECRLVLVNDQDSPTLQLELPRDAIKGIILNPWVDEDTAIAMKEVLRTAAKNPELKVNRTELLNSARWQERIEDAMDQC